MKLWKEIKTIFLKELLLEWRERYALNGLLLYIAGTTLIVYLSFSLKIRQLNIPTWNALFWIILLFTAINAVAKSFMQERYERLLYYYTLISPQGLILAKILYNSILMLVISSIGFLAFAVVLGNLVQDFWLFYLNLVLGSLGFAASLTLVSSIAAKVNNNATLMAILSFPIVLPMLLVLMKVSKNALDGLDRSLSTDELFTLLAINMIVISLSYLLFPFIWRS